MQLHGFFLKRERKEAQETIYETLIEIMKKEENCELGPYSDGPDLFQYTFLFWDCFCLCIWSVKMVLWNLSDQT